MSTQTTTANSRYGSEESSIEQKVESFVDTVTTALATSDADESAVDTVESEGRQLAEDIGDTVEELRDDVEETQEAVDNTQDELDEQPTVDVEDESDPLGSLTVDGLPLGRALRSKVTETDVEEMIDEEIAEIDTEKGGSGDDTPTPESGKDRFQTPLERVCGLPEHVAGDNLTANQERARFVAKGVRDYGRQVPAGIGIRSSEIRRVLSASEESSIHTQTVTRVMDFLAELGGDDVRVKTTRSGERTVVFDEGLAERITHVVTREDGPPVIETGI